MAHQLVRLAVCQKAFTKPDRTSDLELELELLKNVMVRDCPTSNPPYVGVDFAIELQGKKGIVRNSKGDVLDEFRVDSKKTSQLAKRFLSAIQKPASVPTPPKKALLAVIPTEKETITPVLSEDGQDWDQVEIRLESPKSLSQNDLRGRIFLGAGIQSFHVGELLTLPYPQGLLSLEYWFLKGVGVDISTGTGWTTFEAIHDDNAQRESIGMQLTEARGLLKGRYSIGNDLNLIGMAGYRYWGAFSNREQPHFFFHGPEVGAELQVFFLDKKLEYRALISCIPLVSPSVRLGGYGQTGLYYYFGKDLWAGFEVSGMGFYNQHEPEKDPIHYVVSSLFSVGFLF